MHTNTTSLNPAQWRLLPWLSNFAIPTVDSPYRWVHACAAQWADVLDLHDRGMLETTPDKLPAWIPGEGLATIGLSPQGSRFANMIKAQRRALCGLAANGSSVSIHDLLGREDVAVLDPLHRAGMFELRNLDGEISNRSFEEVARFGSGRNWPGLRVRITSKGRAYA